MRHAISEAETARALDEVPVGAVVVHEGKIVGRGYNRPISTHDPSAHAEIVALRDAGRTLGNYRLAECDLYVTLEPCPMCVGAIVQARMRRVFFGAHDPKAGACGGAFHWADQPRFNPRTTFHGGVEGPACAALLQRFFQDKRSVRVSQPVIRTPDSAFGTPDAAWPGFPYRPRYTANLPDMAHLRIHRIDEGPRKAPLTFLCLHGVPGWSYQFRKMLPVWLSAGYRVVAPDLIGFGRSDKWVNADAYRFSEQQAMVRHLIERLDLRNICVVGQGIGAQIAWTLPMHMPERFAGLVLMNPHTASMSTFDPICLPSRSIQQDGGALQAHECAAYDAPHLDASQSAALQAFLSDGPAWDADALCAQADVWMHTKWRGRTIGISGLRDPLGCQALETKLTFASGPVQRMALEQAGHFVPEWGESIAQNVLEMMA